jgi:membrane protease YdiL (CAAX protease family)
MIIFSIITLIVIPAIIGFILKRHRATKFWSYCVIASFVNAFLHYPNAFSDRPDLASSSVGFTNVLWTSLILTAVFYWGAMGLRLLSRWHSDDVEKKQP